MLLACMHVRRQAETEEDKERVGKEACATFWSSLAVSLMLAVVLATFGLPLVGNWWAFVSLVLGYVFGIGVGTSADRASRRSHRRTHAIGRVLGYLLLWYAAWLVPMVLIPFLFRASSLPVLTMGFAVCMLPAHCWGSFSDGPTRRNAWRFLAALVVSAFLYSTVMRFGRVANLYAYRLVRGSRPATSGVQQYLRAK